MEWSNWVGHGKSRYKEPISLNNESNCFVRKPLFILYNKKCNCWLFSKLLKSNITNFRDPMFFDHLTTLLHIHIEKIEF